MNTCRTRLFYTIVLGLSLTLGYNISSALLQDNIKRKLGDNEYYRMMQCRDKSISFDIDNCKRIIV